MRTYTQPGEVLTLTAPSGGVTTGVPVKIGQLLVIPYATVAQTLPFEGETGGVHTLAKTTSQAWTEGQLLYWDNSTSKCTSTAGANLPIGVAAAAALSDATTGSVRLNGTGVDDAGTSSAEINDGAVTAAKLAADAVTTAKILDLNVTAGKLAADAVTTAKILDANVTTAKILDANVTTAKLAASAVTAAKAAVFVSTEQTGTGSEQDVAHGLGVIPAKVLVVPTNAPDSAWSLTEGTHTTANVKVNATNALKYKVLAWA